MYVMTEGADRRTCVCAGQRSKAVTERGPEGNWRRGRPIHVAAFECHFFIPINSVVLHIQLKEQVGGGEHMENKGGRGRSS